MPFNRPTLPQLQNEAEAEFLDRLREKGVRAVLFGGTLWILSRLVAGARHLLHGHLDWSYLQQFAHKADAANLDRVHGDLWDVPRKPSARARGDLEVTVVPKVTDIVIPADTRWRRSDRTEIRSTKNVTITSTDPRTVNVPVEALELGKIGNTAAETVINLSTSSTDILPEATVAAGGLGSGVERETDVSYRARILQRKQNPPMGGSDADFVAWALEVPGVTRAWPIPNYSFANHVGIMIAGDDEVTAPAPSQNTINETQALLNSRKPMTSEVFVIGATPVGIDFTITLIPDLPEIRTAVEQALRDLMLAVGAPNHTIPLSHFAEAISNADGEDDHILTLPADGVTTARDEIHALGTITWT